jgi:phosphatidate phosphatase APP1
VHDRKATLRNTFLNPFQAVPGMAEVYRAWAERTGAQFCYVSASPWQLFLPLSGFVSSNGFPAGMFYLKSFRLKDESVFSLFQNPERYKPAVIEPLLKQFPRRQFVLVGDSGERDPEIYGRLARQYPRQVARIFIRNVSGEPGGAPRYKNAFRDLPSELWKVFQDPSEIASLVP